MADREEAHKLSSLVFRLFNTRNIRGDMERQTATITINSLIFWGDYGMLLTL